MTPYPVTEALDGGHLDVGDGHLLWWEVAGNPAGKPAVLLHGGPGSGSSPSWRRCFDPDRYLIIQFDQRNCGRSTPYAGETVLVDLSTNTTAHLIADCERLRNHLRIEQWLVWGGSCGTTLALAYAQSRPIRVSEMILTGVVTTSTTEVDWVTRQVGRLFPEQWAAFRNHLPPAERDGNLAAAYARLLQNPDPAIHMPAAASWFRWEDTHMATVPGHEPNPRFDDPAFRLCFARLVTHYWENGGFLEDGQLVRDAHRLAGIPGMLIHGALDISSPIDIPWRLVQVWPDAELNVIGGEGHEGGLSTTEAIVATADRFARG